MLSVARSASASRANIPVGRGTRAVQRSVLAQKPYMLAVSLKFCQPVSMPFSSDGPISQVHSKAAKGSCL